MNLGFAPPLNQLRSFPRERESRAENSAKELGPRFRARAHLKVRGRKVAKMRATVSNPMSDKCRSKTFDCQKLRAETASRAVRYRHPSPCPSPTWGEGTLWRRSSRLSRCIRVRVPTFVHALALSRGRAKQEAIQTQFISSYRTLNAGRFRPRARRGGLPALPAAARVTGA